MEHILYIGLRQPSIESNEEGGQGGTCLHDGLHHLQEGSDREEERSGAQKLQEAREEVREGRS